MTATIVVVLGILLIGGGVAVLNPAAGLLVAGVALVAFGFLAVEEEDE